ncbi:hypothetical protein [Peteryoungia ipomoeae]|uniref:Uncharacterized protein n=1 Tax=Peteryoungia ipomoeae TaxID=1210932 RepID=A0A4S8P3T5_9HYPH|nr:hypothetical protein [Peteryoungia ipomoeae]THV24667.1 hypothetical protein FAA97_00160 [Peteryoungia ipomoeae]
MRFGTPTEPLIENQTLVDRMAEELRASSDIGLPHSYFVEQVRLGLADRDLTDHIAANDVEAGNSRLRHASSPSVFNSWARPE